MGDLRRLPKAHLHLHLEGAMRRSTLAELADREGVVVPDVSTFDGFGSFIELYRFASSLVRRSEDLRRLVLEIAEDTAADGGVWVEVNANPTLHPELGRMEEVLELTLDAAAQAADQTGVGVGLILSADRTRPPAEAVALARLATRHAAQGVVGFGLANDEAGFPPEPFAEAFAIARGAGLLSVPHAGELAGPESVRGALDALGAVRLAHGVRAVEDPALVERLAREQVCLDVCPTSNLLLGVAPSLADHPLTALLAAGVPVSLNADDPLLFSPGLLDEYELVASGLALDDATMARIAATSIRASGAPEARKREALAGVAAWVGSAPQGGGLDREGRPDRPLGVGQHEVEAADADGAG